MEREDDMGTLRWSGGFAAPLCAEHTRIAETAPRKIHYPRSDKRNPHFAEEMARVQKLWEE